MKHAMIDFPREIEKALRDDNLVVFAGAGVSRGAPSSLPDFEELVQCIAFGSNVIRDKEETSDRFLGRLKLHGVNVHERAAHELNKPGSQPNTLHHDLLRPFRYR